MSAPDGTTYAISAATMVITLTNGQQVSSRMIAYHVAGGHRVAESPAAPVGRDANGFALGGPPEPTAPANYDHPSRADCLTYLSEVRAWSNYQNQHRPPGSTNGLPISGQVQYLSVVCHLSYY